MVTNTTEKSKTRTGDWSLEEEWSKFQRGRQARSWVSEERNVDGEEVREMSGQSLQAWSGLSRGGTRSGGDATFGPMLMRDCSG